MLRAIPVAGMIARGSVYVENPTLPSVTGQFLAGVEDDVHAAIHDDVFGAPPSFEAPEFDSADAGQGVRFIGTVAGLPVEVSVLKGPSSGWHEFPYRIEFLE